MGKENHGVQAPGADVPNSSTRPLPRLSVPARRITPGRWSSTNPRFSSNCQIGHPSQVMAIPTPDCNRSSRTTRREFLRRCALTEAA